MKSLMSLVLAALAMPLILSCALAGDEGATVERANPDPEASDDYWTPERLQGARPLPLPQPATPPPEAAPPEKPDRQASVSEAGSLGSGEVAPDESNYLFPRDLLPNDPPAPN
jgi:hypothetical protein